MSLIDRLRAQRESWVELEDPPRRAVKIRRPAEVVLLGFRNGKEALELACENVHDWRGFTHADLIGAAVGSSDPAPFSVELWAEVVSDSVVWTTKVSAAVMDAVRAHVEAKTAASGN